ncbi:MAG TPA: hypothetical protein VKA21_05190, partial [Candidatus Binatia bacterium]|nr:hypothetical protein [Candidatus Binatia bacterium]
EPGGAVLARGRKRVSAAGETTVKLVLTARGRRALRHRDSITATIEATFAGAGTTTTDARHVVIGS